MIIDREKIISEANERYKIHKTWRFEKQLSTDIYLLKNTPKKSKFELYNDSIEEKLKDPNYIINKQKSEIQKKNITNSKKNFTRKTPNALTLYYAKFVYNIDHLTFYKVGISTDYLSRFNQITDYDIEFLDHITSDNIKAIKTCEKFILQTQKNKFIPPIKFHGYTECFSEPIDFKSYINFI